MCILNENGILFQDKIGVLTPDLERLVDVLHEHSATEVCMESTSIYWMPVWRILEPYFSLKLVNPYFIKQLPGKKSDVKDAEWIAICLLKDLIRGSYVPEDRIQQLRQYDRRIFDLNKDIVYKLTKLDAALQRCNIRLSNYVSATDGKTYQKVVEKISEGVTDPKVLTGLIHGRIMNRVGKDVITASLTGVITQTDIYVIRQMREEVKLAQKHRDECQAKMEELCNKWFPEQMKNLQTVPGISLRSATSIIAELGTEDHPRKQVPEENAHRMLLAAAKTRGCFYNTFSYHQTVVRCKNKMKVQVAIARKMLAAIWFILHGNVPYRDYTPDIAAE